MLPPVCRRARPGALASLLALALLLALAACGGGATPTPALDTTTILKQTAARLDAVKSVHFAATIAGSAYLDAARTVQLRAATGDIVVPDQMRAKITVAVGAANVDLQLVTIGNDKYQTDLLTGRWGPAQPGFDYSPTILFDKSQGLSSVLGKLRDVQRLADEPVAGQPAYHLRGTVDRATIQPLTSGALDGDPVTTDLWIAPGSYNLLQLVLTEPKTAGKPQPATWTLILSNYDQPVTIERPT